MKERLQKFVNQFGLPRLIILAFFLALLVSATFLNLPLDSLISDTLVRTGMNGVLVLAMVPGIHSGIGLNFGLPLGIVCGLLGGLISIEMRLVGFPGFAAAVLISLPIAAVIGYLYGLMLNRVKGSEMLVATYVGFSAVSLMNIAWLLMPFNSPEIKWPIGDGLRTTITLTGKYAKILNQFLEFNIFGVTVPTGLLLFFFAMCLLMFLFLRTRTGVMMSAAGINPKFATATGIQVDRARIIGTMLSTMLGAVGIIVYSQSYGFYQLYQAPMMMGFAAVAAILIGGASARKATLLHVLIGTFLFQGLLTVSLPVANKIVTEGNLSEIARIIVQNGIILYSLTKVSGGGD
jgi:simple sugar transport system permease protein